MIYAVRPVNARGEWTYSGGQMPLFNLSLPEAKAAQLAFTATHQTSKIYVSHDAGLTYSEEYRQ